jgi:hypothetical protein
VFKLVVSDSIPKSSPESFVQINVMEQPGNAFFVNKTGLDSNAGNARTAPLLTIGAAIQKAVFTGAGVYIGAGSYYETVFLYTGVSIYGGFDNNWVRDSSISPGASTAPLAQQTQIRGGTYRAIVGYAVANLTIDGLTVFSANAVSAGFSSSYGILLTNLANGANITVSNNHITAGNGFQGNDGNIGDTGKDGDPGSPGTEGCVPPSGCYSAAGGPGAGTSTTGGGGTGGAGHQKASGDSGTTGYGSNPGSFGAGATFYQNTKGATGHVGNPATAEGAVGMPPGSAGIDGGGNRTANGYVPKWGTAGAPGLRGSGGGGGGAGAGYSDSTGAYASTGNGGGGGGQGGEGGGGGWGAQGGGGSFGIYSFGSTITRTGNDITVGSPGAGGIGGPGGPPGAFGAGGPGGTCKAPTYCGNCAGNPVTCLPQDFVGLGGNGGNGTAGGKGGKGGDGGAGPAEKMYPP